MPKVMPKFGYVQGIGAVRIAYYHGNGYWMCVDYSDTRRLIHRDRISFRKPPKRKKV